jgi:hypothetical protein
MFAVWGDDCKKNKKINHIDGKRGYVKIQDKSSDSTEHGEEISKKICLLVLCNNLEDLSVYPYFRCPTKDHETNLEHALWKAGHLICRSEMLVIELTKKSVYSIVGNFSLGMFLYLLTALPIFVILRRTVFKPKPNPIDMPAPITDTRTGQVSSSRDSPFKGQYSVRWFFGLFSPFLFGKNVSKMFLSLTCY